MQYKEFLGEVMKRGNLDTVHDAENATRAVMATLGERLTATEVASLGAQLPLQLKEFLAERNHGDFFDLEEFFNRVRARARVGYPDAVRRSQVVMSVLGIGVSDGLLNQIRTSLPPEFGELFGMSPDTPLSPSNLGKL